MSEQGLGTAMLLAPDGIYLDELWDNENSYFVTGGPDVRHTMTARGLQTAWAGKTTLEDRVRQQTGVNASDLTDNAYACTQVVLEAISRAAKAGTVSREAVRAIGTSPSSVFTTVFGTTRFDAHGDNQSQVVTVYAVDWSASITWRTASQIVVAR
jgi:ABC-type branched-subunit amino acid transport system substrate-binding protein